MFIIMQSVGTILRKERKRRKLSTEEVYKKIRIHPDFIKALENDDFGVFSSNVQIKGFLSNYSIFLGLDPQKIIAFWKRDYYQDDAGDQSKQGVGNSIIKRRIVFSPYLFFLIITSLLAFIFVAYLVFVYFSLNRPPMLELYEPQENLTTASKTIHFVGKVDKYSKLILNGKEINYDEEGRFDLEVDLAPGENKFIFTAINRIGRKSEKERVIVGQREE